MTAARYTLRVSVKVQGKEPIKGLEVEPTIMVGSLAVTVKQRWPFLIIMARDFDSEADAEAFLAHVKGGLWNLAIEHNISFNPFFRRRKITRHEDPEEAARNIAKTFGLTIEEPPIPVHGLTEEEGYSIFHTNETIKFMSGGTVFGYVSNEWASVKSTLLHGIQNIIIPDDDNSRPLFTSIDLYLASFYETSIRARFLTLIMCLEVLAPVTYRHTTVIRLLCDFRNEVEAQLNNVTDEEERDALQALIREIDFKKEKSIRRRIRALVLDEAPMEEKAKEALAKKVVDAYDLRSTVVHKGEVDESKLAEYLQVAMEAVKVLLLARLGLYKQRSNNSPPAA